MSGEEGWRGFLAVDGGSPGVLEDEPIGELPVEPGEIGEEKVFVVVDEGCLDGAGGRPVDSDPEAHAFRFVSQQGTGPVPLARWALPADYLNPSRGNPRKQLE